MDRVRLLSCCLGSAAGGEPHPEDLEIQTAAPLLSLRCLHHEVQRNRIDIEPKRLVAVHFLSPLQLTANQPDELAQTRLIVHQRHPLRSWRERGYPPIASL